MLRLVRSIGQKATVTSSFTLFRGLSVTSQYSTTIKDASLSDTPINIANPFEKEKEKCILCRMDITPNYKNVKLLSQFQSPYTGRIYGRHITGLCKAKQEQVEKAIIHAQNCAMMPYYHKDLDFIKDPKLFDPEKPVRPHKY